MAQVALVTGAAVDTMQVDDASRSVRATAAELPGLPPRGYRAIEARARAAAPGWQVEVVPPVAGDAPPQIAFTGGIADARALDDAAWLSNRTGRGMVVSGGSTAQRTALVDGIVARGGQATAGGPAGPLALGWVPTTP
jgi:hypothetical protein